MKRVLAVIFAVAVVVAPGLAGAAEDPFPPPDPVAHEVDPVVAPQPTVEPDPAVESLPAAEAVPAVEPDVVPEPVAAAPAPPVPLAAEVVPTAPVTVESAAEDAYAARLHAELCLARPVFCEVDRSGRYLIAPAR